MKAPRWFLLIVCLLILAACAAPAAPQTTTSDSTTGSTSGSEAVQEESAASPTAGQSESSSASPSSDSITLRLSFKIKGEFAPPVIAMEKGFFEEEGLKVEVLEGTGAGVVLQSLAAGNDHFGYMGAPETALGVDTDIPVVMVANYVKRMPMLLMALDSTPLSSPKDLEGKKLAVSPNDSFSKFLPTFARLNDLDVDTIEQVNLEFSVWQRALLSNQVDVISGYKTNDYYTIQHRTDAKLNILPLWEHQLDFLGHGLVVSRDYLDTNPDTVRKVIRALNRGFEYMNENPEEAAEILVAKYPQALDKAIVLDQIKELNNFLTSENSQGKPLGYNPPEDWKRTLDLLEDSGQIKNRKADSDYFTNEYLPES